MTRHEKFDGDVVEVPSVTPAEKPKKRTRAQRVTAWRELHAVEIKKARDACCTCTPTRAEMLLSNKADDPASIPDNELPE